MIQFEVVTKNLVQCAGAYIKLLTDNDALRADDFTMTGETPYTIMFGPDRCNNNNKARPTPRPLPPRAPPAARSGA